MKKILLLCFIALPSTLLWAADFTYNGLNYNIVSADDKTVETTYSGSEERDLTTYTGDIVIPETVEFEGETYTVTGIGAFSFYSCTDITGTTNREGHETIISVEIPETVTSIGKNAFMGCLGLTSIYMPNSVTSIGQYVCYECSGLTSVHLPENENIKTLEPSLFELCTSLESIELPNSITYMDTRVFCNCGLKSVELPKYIIEIGNYAFAYNPLTTITFPSSLDYIGSYTFRACSFETVISLSPYVPECNTFAFRENPETCILYVPAGSEDDYAKATGWSYFTTVLGLPGFTISEVGYATYYTDVEYIVPEGVTGTTVTGVVKTTSSDADYFLTMPWDYEKDDVVPAGTALVLQGNEGTYVCEISSTSAETPTDNLLMGSTTDTTTTGPNGETTGYVYYELSNGQNGVGFYYGAEGGAAFTSLANKAWLPLTEAESRNARFLGFGKGDETTGISSVESATETTVNGIYTIQGVRVSNTNQPGLYIVDGKKVLVK